MGRARQGFGPAATAAEETPLIELTDVRPILLDTEGRKVFEFEVRRAWVSRDGQHYTLEGITKATLFRDDKPAVILRADGGSFDQSTRNAEIHGAVKISTSDGLILETEAIQWRDREGALVIPGAVLIKYDQLAFRTRFARYLVKTQILSCPNRVVARWGKNWMTASGFVMDGKVQRLTFKPPFQMAIHKSTLPAAAVRR